MRVGYRRCSSVEQKFDRQDLGEVDKLFEEKVSGASADRTALNEMLSFVREGDEVIVYSIDRLARDLRDLETIINKVIDNGASITFITEKLTFDGNSENALDKLMLQIMGAFAEFERKLIRKRQLEGIEKARANNKHLGRVATIDKDIVNRLFAEYKSATKVAKHLSIPENRINYSFYFLDNFDYEFVDYKKCYDAIAKWSDKLDTSEAHF